MHIVVFITEDKSQMFFVRWEKSVVFLSHTQTQCDKHQGLWITRLNRIRSLVFLSTQFIAQANLHMGYVTPTASHERRRLGSTRLHPIHSFTPPRYSIDQELRLPLRKPFLLNSMRTSIWVSPTFSQYLCSSCTLWAALSAGNLSEDQLGVRTQNGNCHIQWILTGLLKRLCGWWSYHDGAHYQVQFQ